jgi:hypothetical protein
MRMRGSRIARIFVVVALALSVVAASEVAAKPKKPKLVVRVNGKVFKANLRVAGAHTAGGVTLDGVSHKGLRNGTTKTLTVACGDFDITTAVLPLTVDCGGAFAVASNHGFSVTTLGWTGDNGLMVTFKTWDGSRAAGTFAGILATPGDTNPTSAPANLTRGKFVVPLL